MVKKIGDILAEYLRGRGWSRQDPCSKVFLEWKAIVGEPLSAHTDPGEMADGVLYIEADHPGWLQMVSLKKEYLLERIRETAPEAKITEIRARLGVRKS